MGPLSALKASCNYFSDGLSNLGKACCRITNYFKQIFSKTKQASSPILSLKNRNISSIKTNTPDKVEQSVESLQAKVDEFQKTKDNNKKLFFAIADKANWQPVGEQFDKACAQHIPLFRELQTKHSQMKSKKDISKNDQEQIDLVGSMITTTRKIIEDWMKSPFETVRDIHPPPRYQPKST